MFLPRWAGGFARDPARLRSASAPLPFHTLKLAPKGQRDKISCKMLAFCMQDVSILLMERIVKLVSGSIPTQENTREVRAVIEVVCGAIRSARIVLVDHLGREDEVPVALPACNNVAKRAA